MKLATSFMGKRIVFAGIAYLLYTVGAHPIIIIIGTLIIYILLMRLFR